MRARLGIDKTKSLSAHGQRGGAGGFVTEGGLVPRHVASLVSAHGQRSGAGGFLTGGGPKTVAYKSV